MDNWEVCKEIKEVLEDMENAIIYMIPEQAIANISTLIDDISELLEGIENQSTTEWKTRGKILKQIANDRISKEVVDGEAIITELYDMPKTKEKFERKWRVKVDE